jgi:arsenate reductase
MITIYHNPRCSKSRETLKLLHDRGIKPRVIEYLKTPPTQSELKQLINMLGLSTGELVRRNEPEFKQARLGDASDDDILRAMVAHPVLIERPIVVAGDKAALGRPPENVLKILGGKK